MSIKLDIVSDLHIDHWFDDKKSNYPCGEMKNFPYNFKETDIAFFSAGSKISEVYAPIAEKNNCYVIDNTSRYRMEKDIPLIVPEINERDLLNSRRKIISNPNCSTIQMLVALAPIHKLSKIKRVIVCKTSKVFG